MPDPTPPKKPRQRRANSGGRHKSKVPRALWRGYISKAAEAIITQEYKGKGTGDTVGKALERKLGVFEEDNPRRDGQTGTDRP